MQATDLLTQLLKAPDARALAAKQVDNITEDFFLIASTYLSMVMAFLYSHCETPGLAECLCGLAYTALFQCAGQAWLLAGRVGAARACMTHERAGQGHQIGHIPADRSVIIGDDASSRQKKKKMIRCKDSWRP